MDLGKKDDGQRGQAMADKRVWGVVGMRMVWCGIFFSEREQKINKSDDVRVEVVGGGIRYL